MTPNLMTWCWWLKIGALATILTGCNADPLNRDSGTLDKFSHAYTGFRDAAFEASVGLQVVSSEPDPTAFWREMREAVDLHSSDAARLRHAANAVDAYETRFPEFTERIDEELSKMAVLLMVELANSLRTADYRPDAVAAAKAARDVHTAFQSMQDCSEKRLRLTVDTLRAIVKGVGRIPRSKFVFNGEELKAADDQLGQAAAQSSNAFQCLKDSFSAIKGRSGMKAYPLEEDKSDNNRDTSKQ